MRDHSGDWWQHYCPKQKDIMSFQKTDECDWCGEKYTSTVQHPQQLLTKKILPIDVFYKVFKNG